MRRLIALIVVATVWLCAAPAWAAAVLTYTLNAVSEVAPGNTTQVTIDITNDSGAGADAAFDLSDLADISITLSYDTRYFSFQQTYRATYTGIGTTLDVDETTTVLLGTLTAKVAAPDAAYRIGVGLSSAGQAIAVNAVSERQVTVATPPADPAVVLKYAGLFDDIPSAGSWALVANTAFSTWTDGCDGTSDDNSGTPCTSTGGLIRTTNAEADAIDSNIGPGNYGSVDTLVLWNGAGRDPVNGCMYLFGGGHTKWYGNEVYQLCMAGPDGPVLARLNDPAPLTATVGGNNIHPNKGAAAVHTYAAVAFIPERQEFVTFAGGSADNGAGGVENTIPGFFSVEYRRWLDPAPHAYNALNLTTDSMLCWSPRLGKLYQMNIQVNLGDIYEYDPETRSHTLKASNLIGWQIPTACVSHGQYIYWMGSANNVSRIHRYDPAINQLVTLGAAPPSQAAGNGAQCMAVDPVNNDLIVWKGTRDLAFFDLDTNAWSTHSPSGSAPTASSEANGSNGVYSKCMFLPEIQTFVGYNNPNEGLWLYRRAGSDWTIASAADKAFEARCADPDVVNCVGVDAANDFLLSSQDGGPGGNVWKGTNADPTRDTGFKYSGASSARFTIASNTGANGAGSYKVNFTPGTRTDGGSPSYPDQFGEGDIFSVSWRQYIEQPFLDFAFSPTFTGANGFKQIIVTAGDEPGVTASSCTTLEVVMVDQAQRGFPQGYHSCNDNNGNFEVSGLSYINSSDFDLQPRSQIVGDSYCSYHSGNPGNGGVKTNYLVEPCRAYEGNKWVEYTIWIRVGTWNTANSYVRFFMKPDGEPRRLLVERRNYTLKRDTSGSFSNDLFGAFWWLPYNTGKSSSQAHATFQMWYDEGVVCRGMCGG